MAELTEWQKAELKALEEMSEEDIDLSDIPERPLDWPPPKRGLPYQPEKRVVTLTLDRQVMDWFEEIEPNEKARCETINRALVEYILTHKFPNRKKSKETVARE